MSALPVTTVPRELVTDLHIRVQWDFTESFLLRCRYRIAVFASRVTTVMNWAFQLLKTVLRWGSKCICCKHPFLYQTSLQPTLIRVSYHPFLERPGSYPAWKAILCAFKIRGLIRFEVEFWRLCKKIDSLQNRVDWFGDCFDLKNKKQ